MKHIFLSKRSIIMEKRNMFFTFPDKILTEIDQKEKNKKESRNYKNIPPKNSAGKNLGNISDDEWQQEYELIYLSYAIDGY